MTFAILSKKNSWKMVTYIHVFPEDVNHRQILSLKDLFVRLNCSNQSKNCARIMSVLHPNFLELKYYTQFNCFIMIITIMIIMAI
jgi:hypothetical protein